jgi:hypothetical protein
MTVANIEPLPSGTAVVELNGITHDFPSWEAAVAECRRIGIAWHLLPFPPLSVDPPRVEVLAVSPAFVS